MSLPKQKVTILHIAERANVSPSTVSRVLNGSARVRQSKREAVEKAVSELNYLPNFFAKSLASGHSTTIGVVTQNVGSPFYDAILLGILQGLEQTRFSPIFADGRWQQAFEWQMIETLVDRRVDGLIVLGGLSTDEQFEAIAQQTPLILIARPLDKFRKQCILVDNFEGAYLATQHLISLGHRKILHLTTSSADKVATDDVGMRFAGYKQALSDAGVPFDPGLVLEGNLMQQSGMLAVERLLKGGRPFTAIFSANDQMAFGARLALFRRGLRVPEDISLVGFDDHPFSSYMIPPLTTVRQPANEMGLRATAAIIDLIENKPLEQILLKPELILRESVARLH
jgi:LacI family transcriptional regulator